MAKHNRRAPLVEGSPSAEFLKAPDGISVRLSGVPPPASTFVADRMSAEKRHGAVSLVFDKLALSPKERVKDRLEVWMAYEPFMAMLASAEAEPFRSRLEDWLAANRHLDDDAAPRLTPDGADRESTMRANVTRIAHSGSEAEICFYAISPNRLSSATADKTSGRIQLEGVVAVTGTTSEVSRFLQDCRRVAEKVRPLLTRSDAT